MEIAGIVGSRWAVVSSNGQHVRTGEGDVPLRKNLIVVAGLAGGEVLRRDLKVPLTSRRKVRRVLPFQLEPLIPFPHEEAVAFAQYYQGPQATDVVAWIAERKSIEQCIATADPDKVSCHAVALARWARFTHPDTPQLVAFTKTLGVAVEGDKIISALSAPDQDKLHAFFKNKYPTFTPIAVDSPFAVPIGLALEGARQGGVIFWSKKTAEERLLYKGCVVGATALFACTLISCCALQLWERAICRQFPQNSVADFRAQVMHAAKNAPSICLAPSVQETLAWLSSAALPVRIDHVSYELAETLHQAVLTLDLHAESEAAVRASVEALKKEPSLLEPNYELTWTSNYRLSFPLRNL